jgi:hypothetical protein
MFKLVSKVTLISMLVLVIASCEDNLMQKNPSTVGGKTSGEGRNPGRGDKKQNPGESYPFPEIIQTEFIPRQAPFNEWKSVGWKITWPWYDGDYDTELIPTVFAINNSELNSINFLNNTDPENTHNGTMSLYYNYKLETANTMWSELDYSFGDNGMETVYFAKTDMAEEHVMDWVQHRPVLWINYWPGSDYVDFEYEEGDFIQFKLADTDRYGVIRIVSMTPRIIEVYLAVPNE